MDPYTLLGKISECKIQISTNSREAIDTGRHVKPYIWETTYTNRHFRGRKSIDTPNDVHLNLRTHRKTLIYRHTEKRKSIDTQRPKSMNTHKRKSIYPRIYLLTFQIESIYSHANIRNLLDTSKPHKSHQNDVKTIALAMAQ